MNRKQHRYSIELEFAEYIQYTDVRIVDLPGNVISAIVGFVYINLQPEYDELSSSTGFEQF